MVQAFSTRVPVAGHTAFSPARLPPKNPASQGCPGERRGLIFNRGRLAKLRTPTSP